MIMRAENDASAVNMNFSSSFAGVHPAVLKGMMAVNSRCEMGELGGYGNASDDVTIATRERFGEIFGNDTEVAFLGNGTASNQLAIGGLHEIARQRLGMLTPGVVFCAENSHLYGFEPAAAIRMQADIRSVEVVDGKLSLEALSQAVGISLSKGPHTARPLVVSITNATETGSCYSPDEVRTIADFCHDHSMLLHMDGCFLANAAVALGLELREATRDLGVDALSLGGMKQGLYDAETAAFFGLGIGQQEIDRFTKSLGQLQMRMPYRSGQFLTYLGESGTDEGIWRQNAAQANLVARHLAAELTRYLGNDVVSLSETYRVFAPLPPEARQVMLDAERILPWNMSTNPEAPLCFTANWSHTLKSVEQYLAPLSKAS